MRTLLSIAVDDLRSCEAAASRAGHREHAAGGIAARFREGGRARRLRAGGPERRDACPPPTLLHLLLRPQQVASAVAERLLARLREPNGAVALRRELVIAPRSSGEQE